MEELLKKFFYTGVGIVSLTAEKLQESVDEMIGEGKVSREEGKKLVDDFVSKVDEKRGEWEAKFKEATEKIKVPTFVTADELKGILSRLEALEEKAGIGQAEDVKEVVKKTTTKAKKASTSSRKTTK
ncbi:MAG: hypothetical protein AAFR61_10590 [Bacteroidota bacterium]